MGDSPVVHHGLRLAGLWVAWLIVMLFHIELGLMPLFHGISVEIKTHISAGRLPRIFLAMLFYFLLPVLALLLVVHAISSPGSWSNSVAMKAGQFWFSLVYSATNVMHWIADIRIPDSRADQVILMSVLTVIGFLINYEAWSWWHP